MRVVVIDSSERVRTRVIEWLRECGIEIVGDAGTLAFGRALIAEHLPDCVVSDIALADARGIEVVAALRECIRGLRIVILTNETHYRSTCLAGGVHQFLDKSRQLDELVPALARS